MRPWANPLAAPGKTTTVPLALPKRYCSQSTARSDRPSPSKSAVTSAEPKPVSNSGPPGDSSSSDRALVRPFAEPYRTATAPAPSAGR